VNELTGKVALVSGAARGQGHAIARRLAAAGARIVAGDLLVDGLGSLRSELGDAVVAAELDVRDRASWDSITALGVETFGRLDILANNAGILRTVALDEESAEAFEEVWRVNCLGPFHGIQAVVPHMRRAGGGVIVNTLSTAAISAFALHSSYVSSKWAHRGLTKVAALELAQYGIRVNAVVPGPIATPMVLRDDDPGAYERLSRTPLGRIGDPEDVAAAVMYLVSDQASFVTGAELTLDGGQTVGTAVSRPSGRGPGTGG
jgi:NAD(P)-dependent dehydrogenase (short-subunit alcohol dehydrogenase family)